MRISLITEPFEDNIQGHKRLFRIYSLEKGELRGQIDYFRGFKTEKGARALKMSPKGKNHPVK